MSRTFLFLLIVTHLVASSALAEKLDFEPIRTILIRRCHKCHGRDKVSQGLRVDSRAALLKGGDGGAAVVPGKLKQSRLIEAIEYRNEDLQMPPDGILSAAERQLLRRWVLAGAVWPGGQSARLTDGKTHWSFQPVRRPSLPPDPTDWSRNAIDRFVRAKLLQVVGKELGPSPEATRATLIRRVYFDLLGLPPSRLAVEAFLQDGRVNAYERLVESLLSSPRYGERWGRHWLDLARYADSNGFEFDFERPNAWRYRDWVIRSFNRDQPYDQFVVEQLAGDEISPRTFSRVVATGFCRNGPAVGNQQTEQNRLNELDDMLSTTTEVFLGLTVGCARCHEHKYDPIRQQDYYGLLAIFDSHDKANLFMGSNKQRRRISEIEKEVREIRKRLGAIRKSPNAGKWSLRGNELVQESMNRNVRLMLGAAWRDYELTVEFQKTGGTIEPFQHEAGIYVAFRSAGLADNYWLHLGTSDNREHVLNLERKGGIVPLAPRVSGRVAMNHWYRIRIVVNGERLRIWLDGKQLFNVNNSVLAAGSIGFGNWLTTTRWRNLSVRDKSGRQLLKGFPQQDRWRLPKDRGGDSGKALENRKRQLEKEKSLLPLARSIVGSRRKPRTTRFLHRGDYRRPGRVVKPAVPAVFQFTKVEFPKYKANSPSNFRRTTLARWTASAKNPLTSRVMVNRIWQHHFGQGLVSTPSDFGLNGARPTHPALLDWLASEFIRSKWSVKHLHRQILFSSTYRQSSHVDPQVREKMRDVDPANRYLWRFSLRRMEAELIRDSILQASGNLNLSMYGLGVRPRIHPSVLATSTTRKWPIVLRETSRHWRRSVYIFIKRSVMMPMLESFDAPTTTQSCERRITTTVATQALQLLNDEFSNEQSAMMADRIRRLAENDADKQIRQVYWLGLSRPPTGDEINMCRQFLAQQRRFHRAKKNANRLALADLCHVIINLNEFVYIR